MGGIYHELSGLAWQSVVLRSLSNGPYIQLPWPWLNRAVWSIVSSNSWLNLFYQVVAKAQVYMFYQEVRLEPMWLLICYIGKWKFGGISVDFISLYFICWANPDIQLWFIIESRVPAKVRFDNSWIIQYHGWRLRACLVLFLALPCLASLALSSLAQPRELFWLSLAGKEILARTGPETPWQGIQTSSFTAYPCLARLHSN
jgi:hypothetical protein